MIYEIVPGFILATLATVVVSLMGRPPESVVATFDQAKAELHAARSSD